MQNEAIQLSIIVPSYNYGHMISRCVGSVISQLEPKHELILVDDGSTDNTLSILQNIKQKHRNKNIEVLTKPNGGVASARNAGFAVAGGQYLLFLDADDVLMPDTLKLMDTHFSSHNPARMFIAAHIVEWENGHQRLIHPGTAGTSAEQRIKNFLLRKKFRPVISGATFFHRDTFNYGLFPEKFRTGEDTPIMVQALTLYEPVVLKEPFVKVYKHSQSLRNQFNYALGSGLELIDEVFSESRLKLPTKTLLKLKKRYTAQRCLSLFRAALKAGEPDKAKTFYKMALKKQPLSLFKLVYARKALRLWLTTALVR